ARTSPGQEARNVGAQGERQLGEARFGDAELEHGAETAKHGGGIAAPATEPGAGRDVLVDRDLNVGCDVAFREQDVCRSGGEIRGIVRYAGMVTRDCDARLDGR